MQDHDLSKYIWIFEDDWNILNNMTSCIAIATRSHGGAWPPYLSLDQPWDLCRWVAWGLVGMRITWREWTREAKNAGAWRNYIFCPAINFLPGNVNVSRYSRILAMPLLSWYLIVSLLSSCCIFGICFNIKNLSVFDCPSHLINQHHTDLLAFKPLTTTEMILTTDFNFKWPSIDAQCIIIVVK